MRQAFGLRKNHLARSAIIPRSHLDCRIRWCLAVHSCCQSMMAFFDLPDHDVLPGEGPGDSNNEERELGFRAALDSVKDRGIPTRLSRPRSLGGAVAWCCQSRLQLPALLPPCLAMHLQFVQAT
jgi:hypothetical protein